MNELTNLVGIKQILWYYYENKNCRPTFDQRYTKFDRICSIIITNKMMVFLMQYMMDHLVIVGQKMYNLVKLCK